MIKITVTGETYLIPSTLHANGFRFNRYRKQWSKIISKENLNFNLDMIRPEDAQIYIKLQQVDVHGNPISPAARFCLNEMDRSADVLALFNKKMSDSYVSPVQTTDPIIHNNKE